MEVYFNIMMKHVSCEFDCLNSWYSALQAAYFTPVLCFTLQSICNCKIAELVVRAYDVRIYQVRIVWPGGSHDY